MEVVDADNCGQDSYLFFDMKSTADPPPDGEEYCTEVKDCMDCSDPLDGVADCDAVEVRVLKALAPDNVLEPTHS